MEYIIPSYDARNRCVLCRQNVLDSHEGFIVPVRNENGATGGFDGHEIEQKLCYEARLYGNVTFWVFFDCVQANPEAERVNGCYYRALRRWFLETRRKQESNLRRSKMKKKVRITDYVKHGAEVYAIKTILPPQDLDCQLLKLWSTNTPFRDQGPF